MKIKYKKNTFFILLLIFPLTIISKLFQYFFLPQKYFTDSYYILRLMNNNIEKEGTAFYVTADFFKKINIFHFSSLIEWSIFLSTIFSVILFIVLLKYEKYKFSEFFFIMATIVLLNIYAFNLSKDIIQLCIFLIVYYIIISKKISNKIKIFNIFVIFVLEAIFFRPYYILIAYGFLLAYYLTDKYVKNKNISRKKILKIIFLFLLLFLITIVLTGKIYPAGYKKIINVRDDVTLILEADTEISNLIPGNNFISFCINYILNGIRILFPIELIIKGLKYFPFVMYQLYLTVIIIKSIKNINPNNIIALSIVVGYFLGSIIYEPDFGSVVRHETTLIMLFVILNKFRDEKGDKYESSTNRDIV